MSDKNEPASNITASGAVDLSKPWSLENDYDVITEIRRIIANDDYTLTVFFNDDSTKPLPLIPGRRFRPEKCKKSPKSLRFPEKTARAAR